MPKIQPERQHWKTFFPAVPLNIRSGIYKVFLRSKSEYPLAFLYFSKSDNRWFDANGQDFTRLVISYTGTR
jgi:hypothetical protein